MDKIVDNRYKLKEILGRGSFGTVYSAKDSATKQKVALKIAKSSEKSKSIFKEVLILEEMKGEVGFPAVYSKGMHGSQAYMAIEKLEENIYEIFRHFDRHFEVNEVISITEQMMHRLFSLHSRGFIHKDIKPQQFLRKKKVLYLVDFGLSSSFLHAGGIHVPFTCELGFTGTLLFASRNAHAKIQLSRRDDLESACYVVIFLLTGTLPWIAQNDEKNTDSKISVRKNMVNPFKIFDNFPIEFTEIFVYIRNLGFTETPDYKYIFQLISRMKTLNPLKNIRIFQRLKFKKTEKFKKARSFSNLKFIKSEIVKKKISQHKKKKIEILCMSTEECENLPQIKNKNILGEKCFNKEKCNNRPIGDEDNDQTLQFSISKIKESGEKYKHSTHCKIF